MEPSFSVQRCRFVVTVNSRNIHELLRGDDVTISACPRRVSMIPWWQIQAFSFFQFLAIPAVWSLWYEPDYCKDLTTLSLEKITILNASYIHAASNISTPGSCQSSAIVPVDVCRIYGVVNTTSDSAVKFEIWLPSEWHGRFLGVGNGGLGGCRFHSCSSTSIFISKTHKVSII